MAGKPKQSGNTISTIWKNAKSPELSLDRDELYVLIYRETRKEHMRDMTQVDIDKVVGVLLSMRGVGIRRKPQIQKRTDEGGNPKTVRLRRKIYMLTGTLGWNNDNTRINSFCKKMCGVERIEWLSVRQCSDIIEGLKKIIERQEAENGAQEAYAEGN